jgi:hypothetical protein
MWVREPCLWLLCAEGAYLFSVTYTSCVGLNCSYATHQKDGRRLYLIGVCDRVQDALQVTRVKQFFNFFDSLAAAEEAS